MRTLRQRELKLGEDPTPPRATALGAHVDSPGHGRVAAYGAAKCHPGNWLLAADEEQSITPCVCDVLRKIVNVWDD